MARDYYGEARAIADELDASGHSATAADLRGAIEAGFTSTEILMALRWHLRNALAEECDLGGAREKMRSLEQGIDQALGDS